MQSLRLCAFLAFIAVFRCYELSQNLAEFYCVLNGNYSDREQVEKDGANRTAFDIRVQPVFAPALSQVPVIYMEESIAGVVLRAYIAIITQEDDDIIYIQRNNFTGNKDIKLSCADLAALVNDIFASMRIPTNGNQADRLPPFIEHEPGTFDANLIKSFTVDDLQGRQDCATSAERIEAFVFASNWQNCRQTNEKGQRGTYASTETCNGHTITIPGGAPEKSTVVAYKFKIQGSKYPLENAPDDYVCNC